MSRKKIGIVTLYDYNYGSALQCFATKSVVESLGLECEIWKEVSTASKVVLYTKRLFGLMGLMCKSPFDTKTILSILLSNSAKNLKLSSESLKKIHNFSQTHLNICSNTFANFKNIAIQEEYIGFLSGSDQVWNGVAIDNHNMRFLRFAPQDKRIAWAPSFGGSNVAKYNKRKYGKYISEYKHLSVREREGVELVNNMTGRTATILCDPVMLLSDTQWRQKYIENSDQINNRGYTLVFFIDEPSDKAVHLLKKITQKNPNEIISFGYKYSKLNDIPGIRHCDGGPIDFLNYVDNAETVLTDSFHATVFSVIFHKNFYVFSRQYQHSQNQSVRLINFLEDISLRERFEAESLINKISFVEAESCIIKNRKSAISYLYNVLEMNVDEEENKKVTEPYLTKALCCGCGACGEICPVNAINMVNQSEDGHYYPYIDVNKCISCDLCRKVCQYYKKNNIPEFTQKAYVAAGNNQQLISHSASGGIFAILAEAMLKENAIIYGATLQFEDGRVIVKHIGVENMEELSLLQGSKYVHSDTKKVFKEVQKYLDSGRKVLFSGTSCQVASLKCFLKQEYETLLTVDLICHGVPSIEFLRNYILYIEEKYGENVVGLTFRRRDVEETYTFTFTLTTGKKITIPLRKSAFYRMFMLSLGYRNSCYHCQYASIYKPADITLGDFYLSNSEFEKIGINRESFESKYLSCILINSDKGAEMLAHIAGECESFEIPMEMAIKKHAQLRYPSIPVNIKLWNLYLKKGFRAVQRKIDIGNMIRWIPKKIVSLIKK